MFIDGTIPEQQYAKNSMRFQYPLKIFVRITEAKGCFVPQQKPIAVNCVPYIWRLYYFFFSKKFLSKVR